MLLFVMKHGSDFLNEFVVCGHDTFILTPQVNDIEC